MRLRPGTFVEVPGKETHVPLALSLSSEDLSPGLLGHFPPCGGCLAENKVTTEESRIGTWKEQKVKPLRILFQTLDPARTEVKLYLNFFWGL